ncbi:MAG TPA: GGDEF domain-containing protein, partial [Dissulfurispiraceae bacterium]|nr:GGDEF domain-containing protein [Dissulfurispiraceae bacterium]
RIFRIAGSQTDITERRRKEEKLLYDAFHDSLTSLPNRSLLIDRLEHALHLQKRDHYLIIAVLVLHLDRFKVINDSLGHRIGDQLLIAVAARLAESFRNCDTIAHIGETF